MKDTVSNVQYYVLYPMQYLVQQTVVFTVHNYTGRSNKLDYTVLHHVK